MAKSKNKKKSKAKPIAIGIAALAVAGSLLPSNEDPKLEDTTPPAIVEEVQSSETTPAENTSHEAEKTDHSTADETPAPITPENDPPSKEKAEIDPEKAFREKLMQYAYVGSAESDKYHEPKCRWTKDINDTNLVHFDSEDEASAAGYEPCGTCKP